MRRSRVGTVLIATIAAVATGCDWVDSTGVQPGDEVPAPDVAAVTRVTIDDVALGDAVGLLEGARARIVVPSAVAGASLDVFWEDSPLAEGALEACAALDGFDPVRAPGTLAEACTDPGACGFSFEAVDADAGAGEAAAFELAVPVLRAPVGRRHALVGIERGAADETGAVAPDVERFRREVDFCLIAFNEAPDARDDAYVIVDGGTLEVGPAAGVLANDTDDDDTSNGPLAVSPIPLVAPARAAFFELRPDGGFTYVPLPAEGGADVDDGFTYEVGDGRDSSSASVTLRTVVGNRAPVPVEGAPPVFATVGEFLFVDLSDRFADPEGARLGFSIPDGLPDGGSLELSDGGVLSGVPGPGDAGEYPLTLLADDGVTTVAASLLLVVAGAPDAGPAFVPGSVFGQTIRLGRTVLPVMPEFEGGSGALAFGSGGSDLPLGVVVDPDTGTVAGRPRRRGTFDGLIVTATDANGDVAASDAFSITVR